ncbi:hypothetical protein [Micromonospora sp. WMMD736]|uniref:hypothetical protein n=1 Tax=Micromonospora sp. WMMD736 TaxID=3404112 RepID=UPI003B94B7D6
MDDRLNTVAIDDTQLPSPSALRLPPPVAVRDIRSTTTTRYDSAADSPPRRTAPLAPRQL